MRESLRCRELTAAGWTHRSKSRADSGMFAQEREHPRSDKAGQSLGSPLWEDL